MVAVRRRREQWSEGIPGTFYLVERGDSKYCRWIVSPDTWLQPSGNSVLAYCEVVVSGYLLRQWIGRPEGTDMTSPSDLLH